jgi:hypothetical protein
VLVYFGAFLDGYTGESFTLSKTLGVWERDIALSGDTALWVYWSRSNWAIFLFRLTSLGLLWEWALFMHQNRDAFLSKCN